MIFLEFSGPAFEKAVRKLRAEFMGMTQEHRERFYKKLEELGIPVFFKNSKKKKINFFCKF